MFTTAQTVVTQPNLNLRYVGLVLQGVGRRCNAQAMHAQPGHFNAGDFGVITHHGIDAIGTDADAGQSPARRDEQRCLRRPSDDLTSLDSRGCARRCGMQQQKPKLAPLALNA